MRIRRKNVYADLELDKRQMLFEYKQWNDQKEKYSTLNRNFQRQNQKLLKQNAILRKQNQQLLLYKEKYLRSVNIPKQSDKMRINMDALLFNSARKQSSSRKNDETNKDLHYAPRSARNCNSIQSRIQTRMNQTQQRITSRKSSVQRSRRRFNYLEEEQTEKTVENIKRYIDNGCEIDQLSFDNLKMKQQKQQGINRNQSLSKKILFHETPRNNYQSQQYNEKSLKQQALIEEIQQLKTIQQQLLKRLQQRGAIIQQLHSLLIISKVKQCNSTKQNDTETIDTALSPKYQP